MPEWPAADVLQPNTPKTRFSPIVLAAAVGLAAVVGFAAWRTSVAVAGRRGAKELMHPEPWHPEETPTDYGLRGETVRIPSPQASLEGWWIPAREETRLAVALFHGHSAHRSQMLKYVRFLSERYNCLVVDFRACGRSPGGHSSMGYFEAEDVRAAVSWLEGQGQERIAGFGLSMGGAAVIRAAAEAPAIACVVADGTFDRVEHVIAKRAKDRGYPFPQAIARAVVAEVDRLTGAALAGSQPVDLIARIAPRPVLIVHGSADGTSRVQNAHRLFEAARYPKELLIVPGATHTEAWETAPAEYERRLMGILGRHLG